MSHFSSLFCPAWLGAEADSSTAVGRRGGARFLEVNSIAYLLSSERPLVPGLNALAYLIFEVLLQTGAAPRG